MIDFAVLTSDVSGRGLASRCGERKCITPVIRRHRRFDMNTSLSSWKPRQTTNSMRMERHLRHYEFSSVLVIALGLMAFAPQIPSRANSPGETIIVADFEASRLDKKLKGLMLFEELNCVACHATSSSLAGTSRKAPRLSTVGLRVKPYFLGSSGLLAGSWWS